MDSLLTIKNSILEATKIGITYHVSPDGDAVGSVLALHNGLNLLGKDSYIISKDKLGDNLQFLPGSNKITAEIDVPVNGTDLVVVLDCGNFDRISANLKEYKGKIVNVDHHISNDFFGEENYIDTKASATAEIVYELLQHLGITFEENNKDINEIGTCIYTALVTDTGGFRHSNVTERTHKIAAALKRVNVNNTYIYQSLFDNKSYEKIKLTGKVLSNTKLLFNGKVSLMEITTGMIKELNLESIDSAEVISFGLQIKGVEVALLVKETEDGAKASLRSKNACDVRKIAEKLGGGGHIKAAGITLKNLSLEEAIEKILIEVEKEI